MKREILGLEFFDRPALTVARELLGKYLVRRVGKKEIALMITETEAYDGHKDKASHASRGQTPRNTPMFGEARTIYVYFTYGMHWMLNIVCGKKGYPAAILIRGLDGSAVTAQQTALRAARPSPTVRRTVPASPRLDGPAKLTKFLHIDRALNNKPLGPKTGLWVEDRGVSISPRQVVRTPRVGVPYAGEYALKPWRFVIKSQVNGTVRRAQRLRGRSV
jgi:DNA-3-methyladenine glycosylase